MTRTDCGNSRHHATYESHTFPGLILKTIAILLAQAWLTIASAQVQLAPSVLPGVEFVNQSTWAGAVEGGVAAIGMRSSDFAAENAGAVAVFERVDGQWQEVDLLTAPDAAAGVEFGAAVALSGDILAIGAPAAANMVAPMTLGSVYIFQRQPDGSWTYQDKLVGDDTQATDWFGWKLALQGDALLVGAPHDDGNDIAPDGVLDLAGSVTFFERQPDGTFTQQSKFGGSNSNQQLGIDVSLADDTLVVGTAASEAQVYIRDPMTPYWAQTATLSAGDAAVGGALGWAGNVNVAISGDTIIVGAASDNDSGFDAGAVYFFGRNPDESWSQLVKRMASDGGPGDSFGQSVAINGRIAVVGAPGDDDGGTGSGAAYVFERRNDGIWSEVRKHAESNFGNLGGGVALDSDSALILPVARLPVFTIFSYLVPLDLDQDGYTDGTDVDSDGDGMPNRYERLVGLNEFDGSDGQADTDGDGFANEFEFRNGTSISNRLVHPDSVDHRHYIVYGNDAQAGDAFGISMALDGDMAAISAPAHDDEYGADHGAIYIFERTDAWRQTAMLTTDVSGINFGFYIGMHGDRVVGVRTSPRALYLFERDEMNQWAAPVSLRPDGMSDVDLLLTSFALGQFGTTGASITDSSVLAGLPGTAGPRAGTVQVFRPIAESPGQWAPAEILSASDGSLANQFGFALDAQGSRALISAPATADVNAPQAAVYVFEEQAGQWQQTLRIDSPAPQPGDSFGRSVDLDGDRALIAAGSFIDSQYFGAAVYVFDRQVDGSWVHTGHLPLDSFPDTYLPTLIKLQGDRAYLSLIENGVTRGVLVFARQADGSWSEVDQLLANDGTALVQFTVSGDTLLASNTVSGVAAPSSGAAYFFFDDEDHDGVGASVDNCVSVANPDQLDEPDQDGIGNVCDLDDDNDGKFDADIPDFELTPGEFFSFTPTAGYGGPDTLTFSLSGQPAWLDFDPLTGRFFATPDNDDFLAGGWVGLTLTASDGGQQSVVTNSFSISLLDTRAPLSLTSVPGGSYNTTQSVSLLCVDATGSGCASVYFTTDGSLPTQASAVYVAPLTINADTTLRFFAVDQAGNAEAPHAVTYQVDTQSPVISVTTPQTADILAAGPVIAGQASDSGSSGLASIEVRISGSNGTGLNAGGTALVGGGDAWVTVCSSDCANWQFDTSLLNYANNITYTVLARALDTAGNIANAATAFLYYDGEPAFTTLSLNLSSSSILFGGTVDAALKLSVPGRPGVDLSGQSVSLTVIQPPVAGQAATSVTLETVTNADGQVTFGNLGAAASGINFSVKGTWTMQASYNGTPLYQAADSPARSLLVGTSAGYAVIVQGRVGSNEGLASHNKTANRIYDTLKRRNFADQNIFYYNYAPSQDVNGDGLPDNALGQEGLGIDGVPSKAVIQSTIENLAGAVNNNPAPVYLIFVDHGNTDGAESEFLLGDESLSPAEVDQWLDTFEAALNPLAAAEARIIITGACYSGGFIPLLSGNHRVVITSAAADEVSYKGPLESDQIRVGEYFLEEFFQGLDRGESLANAFVVATDKTETYTRESDAANSANVYLDSAVQHPLLDDNGDGIGANVLQAGADEDGVLASGLYLGTGPAFNTNSVDNPADVRAVSPTQFLGAAQNAATLRLTANDNAQVAQAIVEVRAPDAVLAGGVLESGGTPVTEQQAADSYDRRLLNAPGTQGCAANQFCLDYDGFTAPGRYEIFYYVEDVETGALSPGERSVVYKTTGANQSPAAFNLSQPANGATVHTVSGFSWQASSDPDGDAVTYTLRVCTDPTLSMDCVVQEEIDATITVVTEGLADLTTYYWQVQAVDVYGALTASSNVFSFDTDDGNSVLGVIKGFVQSSRDLALLTSHLVTRTNNGIPLEFVNAETDEGGQYILVTLAGQAQLQATALGFESSSATVVVPEPVIDPNTFKSTVQTVRRDFILAEEPPPAADSDGDGLSDDDEVNVYGTQPDVADSDDDGLNDGAEVLVHGTNPNDADTDDDGLTDGAEVLQYGSDPTAADSDNDGVNDGVEVAAGRNPTVNEPAVLMRIIDLMVDE